MAPRMRAVANIVVIFGNDSAVMVMIIAATTSTSSREKPAALEDREDTFARSHSFAVSGSVGTELLSRACRICLFVVVSAHHSLKKSYGTSQGGGTQPSKTIPHETFVIDRQHLAGFWVRRNGGRRPGSKPALGRQF